MAWFAEDAMDGRTLSFELLDKVNDKVNDKVCQALYPPFTRQSRPTRPKHGFTGKFCSVEPSQTRPVLVPRVVHRVSWMT